MFNVPLYVPRDTVYRDLGLRPEALADEIRDAKTDAMTSLDHERADVDRELRAIEAAVPALVPARTALKVALARPDQDAAELAAAREAVANVESQANRANPRFRELQRRVAEIEERQKASSQIALDNIEERRTYDRAHPPLELLKLADATRDAFVENRTAMGLLRRDLSRFLARRGAEVFHPTDIYREEFGGDFARNPLVDGESDVG